MIHFQKCSKFEELISELNLQLKHQQRSNYWNTDIRFKHTTQKDNKITF